MLLREWHILSAAVSVACQQSDECTLLVGGNTMRVAVSVSILNKASKKTAQRSRNSFGSVVDRCVYEEGNAG